MDLAGCKRPFFDTEEEALECKLSTSYNVFIAFIFMFIFLVIGAILSNALKEEFRGQVVMGAMVVGAYIGWSYGSSLSFFDPVVSFHTDEREIATVMKMHEDKKMTREQAKEHILVQRARQRELQRQQKYERNMRRDRYKYGGGYDSPPGRGIGYSPGSGITIRL